MTAEAPAIAAPAPATPRNRRREESSMVVLSTDRALRGTRPRTIRVRHRGTGGRLPPGSHVTQATVGDFGHGAEAQRSPLYFACASPTFATPQGLAQDPRARVGSL